MPYEVVSIMLPVLNLTTSFLDSAVCAMKDGRIEDLQSGTFILFWWNLCFSQQKSTAQKTATAAETTHEYANTFWISSDFTLNCLWSLMGTFPLSIRSDSFCQLQASPVKVSTCLSFHVREVGDTSGCMHTFLLTYQLLPPCLYHKYLHNHFSQTRNNNKVILELKNRFPLRQP